MDEDASNGFDEEEENDEENEEDSSESSDGDENEGTREAAGEGTSDSMPMDPMLQKSFTGAITVAANLPSEVAPLSLKDLSDRKAASSKERTQRGGVARRTTAQGGEGVVAVAKKV
jgi:cobalamin biosynthesis protein CobT